MKYLLSFFVLLTFSLNCTFGQGIYRIDKAWVPWVDGTDGYAYIDLPNVNPSAILPAELNEFQIFSIFNIPFQITEASAGKFATSKDGHEELSLNAPKGTTEILFVMVSDFPREEISRSWALVTPLHILSEPERADMVLVYSDGETEEMMPVNADYKCYGISHGRALYSVTAKSGKTISKMVFRDKMHNASFQILAATANQKLMPRIAKPDNSNLWYPLPEKVALSDAEFMFDTSNGFSWQGIVSEMLPLNIDLKDQPVFLMEHEGVRIPSTEWKVKNISPSGDTMVYTIDYIEAGLHLQAILKSVKSKRNEATLSLTIKNLGKDAVNAKLFFPILSNIKIGSVAETWYTYARSAVIINRINCSFRDYLGSEKPLQFDGVFNPSAGVGLGIFPRDTSDFFRWYNFSKDCDGVNYALEYTPVSKKTNQSWKSVPVALAVTPGDWKDQFSDYKNWVSTWSKKSTPTLDWFKKVFAFTYYDNNPNGKHEYMKAAMDFKERFGTLDYLHIFAWANTDKYGHWGDYSHYEGIGGKKEFVSNIKKLQEEQNIPVGLYLDGYLITDEAEKLSNQKKFDWAIKQADGTPFRSHNSYVECLYVKDWRDFLVKRFKEVEKVTGAKGLYCDELGMSLRARVCYDTSHGHEVPYYMAASENQLMKELKAALPGIAIYNEFGGTDVMSQYSDGGLTYLTSWNSFSPEWFNVTGNVPYNEIAPYFLDLRRFAFPDMKTFDVIMTQVPWKDGNWSLGKFPFFNGNSYFHRVDVGRGGDEEAVEMFRKIRFLQNEYKLEFSSTDVEPFISTLYPNIFANRFSSDDRDVYTLFNAGYREADAKLIKVHYRPGSAYKDVWNNREIEIIEIEEEMATLRVEIGPRAVICIVSYNQE